MYSLSVTTGFTVAERGLCRTAVAPAGIARRARLPIGRGPVRCRASKSKVTFTTKQHVHFREQLRIVGSAPELGNWDIVEAPPLSWKKGDKWALSLALPEGSHEYKLVIYNVDSGASYWEGGYNRTLKVSEPLKVQLAWEKPEQAGPDTGEEEEEEEEEEGGGEKEIETAAAEPVPAEATAADPEPAEAAAAEDPPIPAPVDEPAAEAEPTVEAKLEAAVEAVAESVASTEPDLAVVAPEVPVETAAPDLVAPEALAESVELVETFEADAEPEQVSSSTPLAASASAGISSSAAPSPPKARGRRKAKAPSQARHGEVDVSELRASGTRTAAKATRSRRSTRKPRE